MKRDKHVNLLYMQDSQNNNVEHFGSRISRLVNSQLSRKEYKKHFCDWYVQYIIKNYVKIFCNKKVLWEINKLSFFSDAYTILFKCKTGDPRNRLRKTKQLSNYRAKTSGWGNYIRKERIPFMVYADLECILEKTEKDIETSSYTYHRVFNLAYVNS